MKIDKAEGRPSILAYPIHGHAKLRHEGFRTRDGHLIEWFANKTQDQGPVHVISRPEPVVKRIADLRSRAHSSRHIGNITYEDKLVARLPDLRDRYAWWPTSSALYPSIRPDLRSVPAAVWNPFIGMSNIFAELFNRERTVVFDLLDDWTIHYSFAGIRKEVEYAYGKMFDAATHVTANAEGTLELARRFGRSDAVMIPNGCDPEKFSSLSRAKGPITIGYVGKLGRRVDDDLIISACLALPECHFIIAGPILDGTLNKKLASFKNCELIGDVHYDNVPALLEKFDLGWVPHRVGEGEVGGDVIKTYEYRAAGLPVLSTPIGGVSDRGLSNVFVLPAEQHVTWMQDYFRNQTRIERRVEAIPESVTWERKSAAVLDLLKVSSA